MLFFHPVIFIEQAGFVKTFQELTLRCNSVNDEEVINDEFSNVRYDENCIVNYHLKHTDTRDNGIFNYEGQNKGTLPNGPMSFLSIVDVGRLPRFLPLDLKIGDSFKDSDTGEYYFNVIAIENVSVPAGTFESYRIEATRSDSNGGFSEKLIIWLSKGIGVVKIETIDLLTAHTSPTVELMEFSGAGQ
jgi:hypothetical protein